MKAKDALAALLNRWSQKKNYELDDGWNGWTTKKPFDYEMNAASSLASSAIGYYITTSASIPSMIAPNFQTHTVKKGNSYFVCIRRFFVDPLEWWSGVADTSAFLHVRWSRLVEFTATLLVRFGSERLPTNRSKEGHVFALPRWRAPCWLAGRPFRYTTSLWFRCHRNQPPPPPTKKMRDSLQLLIVPSYAGVCK